MKSLLIWVASSLKSVLRQYTEIFLNAKPVGKLGIGCGTLFLSMCLCFCSLAIFVDPEEPNQEQLVEENQDSSSIVSSLDSNPDDEIEEVATVVIQATKTQLATISATSTESLTNTPTPVPTNTSEPTLPPATNTIEPSPTIVPTSTSAPPTNTPEPLPTNTSTPVPVPPTNTPVPVIPTDTPAPVAPALPAASYNGCQDDPNAGIAPDYPVRIVTVQKKAKPEEVILENVSGEAIDLSGWRMCSITGNQLHEGIGGSIGPGETKTYVYTGSKTIWNNSDKDDGALYNPSGQLVSYWRN